MKRGRKSKAEKDKNFISHVLDYKRPWPWPKVTAPIPEIQRSYMNSIKLPSENNKVALYYYAVLYAEWLEKKRASNGDCQP